MYWYRLQIKWDYKKKCNAGLEYTDFCIILGLVVCPHYIIKRQQKLCVRTKSVMYHIYAKFSISNILMKQYSLNPTSRWIYLTEHTRNMLEY
jgi:hypothetical protein